MAGEMDGKVALVVGAGPGVGAACARAFANAGATVVVAARRETPLVDLAQQTARSSGRTVTPIQVDLADLSSCRDLVDATRTRFGGVDAVVNVATAGGGGAPVIDDDLDRWRSAFEVNVLGTLEISRRVASSMIERGGGSIVQIGTLGMHSRPPRLGAYTSTKQAMVTASLTLAKELGRWNVRVNVVTPGYIHGEGLDQLIERVAQRTGEDYDDVSDRLAATGALRRHVESEDIAEAVLFLSSPRARNVTGIELPVAAGQGL